MGNYLTLGERDLKKSIKTMMATAGVSSIASIARDLDMKETTLRSAISNNSLRVVDLIRITEKMGYEIIVKETDN